MSQVEQSKLREACELCAANFGKEDDKELQERLYNHICTKFVENGKSWSYGTIIHVLEKWLKVK